MDGFRQGLDLYFERHDGEATTVEKFIASFEDACKVDLTQFMLWYRQSGTPELVCTLDYDAKKQQAALTIEQVLAPTPGQPRKKPFHMPVRMGLLGGNGDAIDLLLSDGSKPKDGILELTKAKQTFTFKGVTSRPVASLLRDFSAPVNLSFAQSADDLEFLMVHDSDLYNRWQAAQTYATRLIVDLMAKTKGSSGPKDLARAVGHTIADEKLEPAYRAMMMALPSESDIAREVRSNVDPSAIHAARQAVRRDIGMALRDDLETLYAKHALKGPYQPDAGSAGHRSIRLAALGLMTVEERPADIAKLTAHFSAASNMTDQMTALAYLADIDGPERVKALAAFEKQWGGDSLVMDKWFATQAMSDLPGTVEAVAGLQKHKLFQLTNPNKVRALIGAFAHGNQLNFNRADGAGYDLVAGVAIDLNKHNPQVAARLMGAFRSWQTLEPKRRKLAKAALERVNASAGLSRDVFEIVTKTLQAQD